MNETSAWDLAQSSKHLARSFFEKENYGKAFAHLLVALKLDPDCKDDFKFFFSSVLSAWGKSLETQGRFTDLFKCYQTALEIFPENELVSTNLGAHLLRLRHYHEAQHYFQEALKVNCNYLPAFRNLQNVSNCLVERWHFRMLNDGYRNEAFRKAIHKKIEQGFDSILDIGTGCGLLSLYAVKGHAKHVYACDYSETMIEIARDVMSANTVSDRIKLINKLSDDIKIPEDIPSRLSLIVTETVDAGLLGEHILETVLNAWENLLLPQNSISNSMIKRVLPHGAILYMTPIQCSNIGLKKHVFRQRGAKREFLNELDNIIIRSASLKRIISEPYDTENLYLVPDGHVLLSDTKKVFEFDFNDPSVLSQYFHVGISKDLSFLCTSSGYIDAVAVWFDLSVDDEIVISTSPEEGNKCCWDQAVFLNQDLQFVEKGMLIDVNVTCKGGLLSVGITGVCFPEGHFSETRNLPDNNLMPQDCLKFLVSESMITFLNNGPLIEALIKAKDHFCGQKIKLNKVLDLFPFPVLGLLMAKEMGSEVNCFLKIKSEIEYMSELLKLNDLKSASVEFKSYEELLNLRNDVKYNSVFVNFFETSGELNEDILNFIPKLRKCLTANAVIIPSYLDVCVQLVHSDWLNQYSVVQNKSLESQFKVSEFINKYKVSQCIDLNLRSIPFEKTSQKVQMCRLSVEDLCNDTHLIFEKDIAISSTDFTNAVIYWFEYDIMGTKISTFHPESHISQTAELFFSPVYASKDSYLKLKLTYNVGIFRFELIKEDS